jgi:glycerophosphoryl diester phosphodiesterase
LPPALRRGEDPAAPGDYAALWHLLAAAGVDGVFTDNPREAVAAR